MDAIGEQSINQTLILGDFGNLFDYLAAQQGAADMMNALVSSIPNFTVAEYLAWVRSALGESTYQNLLQSSPQALNFDRVITLEEQYLYGSKRLGVRRPGLEMARAAHNPSGYEVPVEPTPPAERFGNACLCTEPIPGDEEPYYPGVAFTARFYTHTLGMKEYELTNHLGNVLATVLDRKTGVKASPTATTYEWFKADVTTAQDYYPFGSLMPGRTYVAPTGVGYRFGFNTQEKVDEISGIGNHYSALYWEYDCRLGRRWNLDPVVVPEESQYTVNKNNPISFSDPKGDCPFCPKLTQMAGTGLAAASVEAGVQFTVNYTNPNATVGSAIQNIDFADVFTAFVEGAMTNGANVKKIMMRTAVFEGAKAGIDLKYDQTDNKFGFSSLGAGKPLDETLTDYTFGIAGGAAANRLDGVFQNVPSPSSATLTKAEVKLNRRVETLAKGAGPKTVAAFATGTIAGRVSEDTKAAQNKRALLPIIDSQSSYAPVGDNTNVEQTYRNFQVANP